MPISAHHKVGHIHKLIQNNGILVEDDNKPKTQTLPRSYKTGMGGTGSKTRKGSTDQVAIPTPNRPIGRAQSTNRY